MRLPIHELAKSGGVTATALRFRPERAAMFCHRGIPVGWVGSVSPRAPFVPHSTRGYSECHRYAARHRFQNVESSGSRQRNSDAIDFSNLTQRGCQPQEARNSAAIDFSILSQRLVPAPKRRDNVARGGVPQCGKRNPGCVPAPKIDRPTHSRGSQTPFRSKGSTESCGHPPPNFPTS